MTNETSNSGAGERQLDAEAVDRILADLKTAACTGWLSTAEVLDSLSWLRAVTLGAERAELALIDAAIADGAPWEVVAQTIGGADDPDVARTRRAQLALRHGYAPRGSA